MPDAPDSGTTTRRALLRRGRARLRDAGRDAPHRLAEWLLMDAAGCARAELYAHPEAAVEAEAERQFEAGIARCAAGEPVQHVLGTDDFYGLTLTVTPDVLIPRPETEEVVERALHLIADVDAPRILDVGTGSGCIALALRHERPDAVVHACDVSADALAVARENAQRLSLDIAFHQADLTADDFAARVPGGLDLLISNPPYIPDSEAATLPPVVRDYDPHVALFAGDDPLRFYRALARVALDLCAPGGLLVVETHADHATGVGDVFRDARLTDVHVEADLADRPRIAWARRPARPHGAAR